MLQSPIQATIFYRHSEDEVQELAQAIEPLGEHIRAVGSDLERQRLRTILLGNDFRRRDVKTVTDMLCRAAKHARGHLGEYFWQDAIIKQVETLEDAVGCYRTRFKALQADTIPVH